MTTLRDSVRVDRIIVKDGRRRPDASRVRQLAESIREIGLLNPPVVTYDDDETSRSLVLIAGAHRLAAVALLGWSNVDVLILVDYEDKLCELAEIDENLVRQELTPVQRAEATDRRKGIWEALHPEATAEAKRADGRRRQVSGDLTQNSAPSFTESTSAVTGRSRRSVEVDAQIGAALRESPEAAEVARDAERPLTQAALLAVAKAPAEQRAAAAKTAAEKAAAPKYGPGKVRKPKPTEKIDEPPSSVSGDRSWRSRFESRSDGFRFVWGDSETSLHADPIDAAREFFAAIGVTGHELTTGGETKP